MFDIAIVDDKFPYDINTQDAGMPFQESEIKDWLGNADWEDEHALKDLVDRLLSTDLAEHSEIRLLAFVHPTALLDYLRSNDEPDLIVFDWEYQTNNEKTRKQLAEILETTSSTFIFVYSALAMTMWQFLSGEVFEKNRKRFRLLKKGEKSTSLFTSEDNIIQSVISKFEKAYQFEIQGNRIRFEENRYIKKPNELKFFESILGKENLLLKIEESNYEISDTSVQNIFGDTNIKFYLSKDSQYLLDSGMDSNREKYGPLTELTFLDALEDYGSDLLNEVLERGISQTQI